MSEDFDRSPIYNQPSFLRGLARLIDFNGELDTYKSSSHPDEAVLEQDWRIVGRDIQLALKKYGQQ